MAENTNTKIVLLVGNPTPSNIVLALVQMMQNAEDLIISDEAERVRVVAAAKQAAAKQAELEALMRKTIEQEAWENGQDV